MRTAFVLLGARQLRHDFERFSAATPIHIVPPLCPVGHSSYDYSQAASLIARSGESKRTWLAADGFAKRSFPGELGEHMHAA